ncbi:four-carbon acid sugar kinase family protein [Mitsuokella jalaludinii]|uniref:four-carbon acid sugar kinase family protein n=1 Tax=Mitsuokella jalaludinii TaxID=187979 RepID=UPI00307A09A7
MENREVSPSYDISFLDTFPTLKFPDLQERLLVEATHDNHKIVVLDDDPTGVQTLHDVSVFTNWSESAIEEGFREKQKLFYILTNSRSFSAMRTKQVHQEIAERILTVAQRLQKDFLIISRSDSTLRGHYPLETQTLRETLEAHSTKHVDGEILCPYFKEGGRFTFGDVHYVCYGRKLVPVGQTEFAEDQTFGYHASNLRDYVEEKTQGAYKRETVMSISISELRQGDVEAIAARLCQVHDFGKVIVNAVTQDDVRVFVLALYEALSRGKYFLFRTAAAFVKEMGAIEDRPLLTHAEIFQEKSMAAQQSGGVIVVGSHTEKTTAQLKALQGLPGLEFLELDSDLVLKPELFSQEVTRILEREEAIIRAGKTAVIYTKRKVLTLPDDTKESALARSVKISDAVQSLVGRLSITPSYVIAKGGITSSDVATKALHVHKATVIGQICPGVPVWRTGRESKFPQIPYIIFPGNVGDTDTLRQAVLTLQSAS